MQEKFPFMMALAGPLRNSFGCYWWWKLISIPWLRRQQPSSFWSKYSLLWNEEGDSESKAIYNISGSSNWCFFRPRFGEFFHVLGVSSTFDTKLHNINKAREHRVWTKWSDVSSVLLQFCCSSKAWAFSVVVIICGKSERSMSNLHPVRLANLHDIVMHI